MINIKPLYALLICAFATGCAQPISTSAVVAGASQGSQPAPTTAPKASPNDLGICSNIDFSKVVWPSSMSTDDRAAFELALNIDGSYEGNTDWGNITNNFDGEGLSMGLLDQTLGTGSLQPLLIAMKDQDPQDLENIFSSSHLKSFLSMINTYQSTLAPMDLSATRFSLLDEEAAGVSSFSVRENQSVQWALKTIYLDHGVTFNPTWKSELQALGRNEFYISLQIAAAMNLHNQAKSYMSTIGVAEVRTYLLAFDVAAQNGSFYPQDLTAYAWYVKNNPHASDTQKLLQILTYRLREVRSEFVSDVRSRKLAIINGSGIVHGDARNLESEYCFNRLATYL